MGKTRWLRLALPLLALFAFAAFFVHNPVTKSAPAPAQATAAPAGAFAGVTVCLDAGHGGYDGGAVGRDSGVQEKELNLDVARRLQTLLENDGARVIMTRAEDVALAGEGDNRKRRDLAQRVACAAEADVFLSIHMNEYRTRNQSGPQVFYRRGEAQSRLLAGALQESMNEALSPARPRSANTGEYYLLEHLTIPAVLVECGFLSNAAEEALLLTDEYRQRVAESIRDGLTVFLSLPQTLANGG